MGISVPPAPKNRICRKTEKLSITGFAGLTEQFHEIQLSHLKWKATEKIHGEAKVC